MRVVGGAIATAPYYSRGYYSGGYYGDGPTRIPAAKAGGTITLRATVLSAVPALCSADKMVNSIFGNKVLS